jgi:hypothetical protein
VGDDLENLGSRFRYVAASKSRLGALDQLLEARCLGYRLALRSFRLFHLLLETRKARVVPQLLIGFGKQPLGFEKMPLFHSGSHRLSKLL